MSILFLVATPIGNLDDISARAIKVLSSVRLIAAEDTRHTGKLLKHFNIQTNLSSFHKFSKQKKQDKILEELSQGDVALVSDAGTPTLNDPGFKLVQAALQEGHEISPIPGPSAPIAALVASGLPTNEFLYLGYSPRKGRERRQLLQSIKHEPYTIIFLEAPHRLLDALSDMQNTLGDRNIAVARELTKLHEEIFRGKISSAMDYFTSQKPRGEFTLVIAGHHQENRRWTENELLTKLENQLTKGEAPTEIAVEISKLSGWPRREVYRKIVDIQKSASNS